MKFEEFYNKQRKLDNHILKNQFQLSYVTTEDHAAFLPQLLCAAFVEAGEFAEAEGPEKLEEYIDIFHFLLSIHNALDLRFKPAESFDEYYSKKTVKTLFPHSKRTFDFIFIEFIKELSTFANTTRSFKFWSANRTLASREELAIIFSLVMSLFCKMGNILGYSIEDVISAYNSKNSKNHTRQEEGY